MKTVYKFSKKALARFNDMDGSERFIMRPSSELITPSIISPSLANKLQSEINYDVNTYEVLTVTQRHGFITYADSHTELAVGEVIPKGLWISRDHYRLLTVGNGHKKSTLKKIFDEYGITIKNVNGQAC